MLFVVKRLIVPDKDEENRAERHYRQTVGLAIIINNRTDTHHQNQSYFIPTIFINSEH